MGDNPISLMKLTKAQLLELYTKAQHKINRIQLALDNNDHDYETFYREVREIIEEGECK